MARNYSEEEKREYLDRFKVSGKSKTIYARENGIPECKRLMLKLSFQLFLHHW